MMAKASQPKKYQPPGRKLSEVLTERPAQTHESRELVGGKSFTEVNRKLEQR